MNHKLLMGYQGWFSCPGDGSRINGYFHWFRTGTPDAQGLRVDMWPDASELTPDERCATNMTYPNGEPAYLYSAQNPKTVVRHFQWMSQYGVDGVFLQRFVSELSDSVYFDARNVVTKNVLKGAEAYGRTFSIMYATSPEVQSSTFLDLLEQDWKYMVDVLKVTNSPAYQRHNGKPVVAIWGLGFKENTGTPEQAMELVDFFENNPDPKYQATLVGGVPTSWRTLENDSLSDPAWANYYCALDVISPWTVGRYSSDLEVDLYKRTMQDDMTAATNCGAEYMPVVYPGTALHNAGGTPFNLIPRRGGDLYWRQVFNAVSLGVPMIYNAMFDEVDEDTAMYKVAATKDDQPVGVDLVSLDADGYALPNDWYLRLAGAATEMLRGDIPLSPAIPIESGATPPPLPAGTHRIRIQLTTSSDFATVNMTGGGSLQDAQLASVSSEATSVSGNGNRFAVAQPIARANSGGKLELVIDVYLSGLQAGVPLHFELESGAIGHTTVKIYSYVQESLVEVTTMKLGGTSKAFDIPVEQFIAQSA